MKFVHAYVLCALSIAAQMKGADYQQFDEKQSSIKGLTELIAAIPQKTRWTRTGKQIDPLHTFVIFGSTEAESTPILDRSINVYPFRQTQYNKNEAKALIKSYGTAFKTHLNRLEEKEAIKHFSSDRTLIEQEKRGSSKSECKKADALASNDQTKGPNELKHEIQKSIAALAIRDRYLQIKIRDEKELQQNLLSYTPVLNNDFVCFINALIHDIKTHNSSIISDEQALQQLFADESQFKKSQEKFNNINQNDIEAIPNFEQFNACYGILPLAIAEYAHAQHNNKGFLSWLFAESEPALAADLKTANHKLASVQDAQQKEELLQYVASLRATLYATLIQNIRSITGQDLAKYVAIKNDRQRLVYVQDYIAQAEQDTRAEEQKIAQQLQPILPKDITSEKAIEAVMGWPKNKAYPATIMAARLAKTLA